jgi:hypothetical protein
LGETAAGRCAPSNLAAMAALGAVALFWAGRRFRQTLN